jgi:hypothetical protein
MFGGIATAVMSSGHYHFPALTSGHPAVSAAMPLVEFGVDKKTAQFHLVDYATGH